MIHIVQLDLIGAEGNNGARIEHRPALQGPQSTLRSQQVLHDLRGCPAVSAVPTRCEVRHDSEFLKTLHVFRPEHLIVSAGDCNAERCSLTGCSLFTQTLHAVHHPADRFFADCVQMEVDAFAIQRAHKLQKRIFGNQCAAAGSRIRVRLDHAGRMDALRPVKHHLHRIETHIVCFVFLLILLELLDRVRHHIRMPKHMAHEHADRNPPLLIHCLKRPEDHILFCHISRVEDRGHSAGDEIADQFGDAAAQLLFGRRLRGEDRHHGHLRDHTGQPAAFIPLIDTEARRDILCIFPDAEILQRRRIQNRAMAFLFHQDHRSETDDLIQIVSCDRILGQHFHLAVEHRVEQTERMLFHERPEFFQHLFLAFAVVHRHGVVFVIAPEKHAHGDVGVGVDDPGHNEPAAHIVFLRRFSCLPPDLVICSDAGEYPVLYRKSLRPWIVCILRVDLRVCNDVLLHPITPSGLRVSLLTLGSHSLPPHLSIYFCT